MASRRGRRDYAETGTLVAGLALVLLAIVAAIAR